MSTTIDTAPARTSWIVTGGYLLLAVAGFVITSALVRKLTPWPEEYGLRAKFDHFAEHKDEFDVAFVGSSRVFRAVDPRIVDAGLRAAGVEARSFNLAVGGMTGFESDFLLKEVLALEPRRLKVVVIEDQSWDASSYFLGNTFSSRSIFWHSPAETALALRSVFASGESASRKIELAWTHVRLCGMKLASIGQGSRIVLDLLGRSRDPLKRALSEEQLIAGAGYQPLDDLLAGEFERWRADLLAHKPEFDALVAAIPDQNARPADLSHYNFAALAAQNAAASRAGAALVRIVPPGSEGQPEVVELARRGDVPRLLDYNDPVRFPRYFELGWRFDNHHLNREGAEDLSRRVAADLAPIVRAAN